MMSMLLKQRQKFRPRFVFFYCPPSARFVSCSAAARFRMASSTAASMMGCPWSTGGAARAEAAARLEAARRGTARRGAPAAFSCRAAAAAGGRCFSVVLLASSASAGGGADGGGGGAHSSSCTGERVIMRGMSERRLRGLLRAGESGSSMK